MAGEEGETPVRLAAAVYVQVADCVEAIGEYGGGECEEGIVVVNLEVGG